MKHLLNSTDSKQPKMEFVVIEQLVPEDRLHMI